MSKIYVGIDPGYGCTAIMVLNHNGDRIGNEEICENKKHIFPTTADRILNLYTKVCECLVTTGASEAEHGCIAVEEPMGSSRGAGVKVNQAFTCVVLAIIHICGCVPEVYTPGQIKKFATGTGNANKIKMAHAVKKMGYESDNEHLIDAYAIAKYVKSLA